MPGVTTWLGRLPMKRHTPGLTAGLHSIVVMALALAVSPLIVAAQTQSSSVQLDLADIYRLIAKSPRIAASDALAIATQSKVASAKRPPDPQLQLGFMNRSLPSLAPMDPLGMTQIQLMQMIPTPGKLRLAGRIADDNAAASRARAADTRWDVRARAAMSFYDLYVTDAQLRITRDTKNLVQEIAKASQAMYSVGDGKQAEVLRAQVEVARMTAEITRMEGMHDAMTGRLRAILDMPDTASLGTVAMPALPDSLPPLAVLIAEADRNRPMIGAGEREVSAAESGIRLARKEIWPDLQIGLQYGWRGGAMGTERMGSLMVGATVPVYAHSRQLKMRDEATAMRAMAAADLNAARAETRGRMTELYADFTKAKNLRALYQTTILPQADAAVTASFSAYRVGTINLMTLLDNQMALNRYRQELVSLEGDQGKAIAEIEMLLGRELFDPTSTVSTGR